MNNSKIEDKLRELNNEVEKQVRFSYLKGIHDGQKNVEEENKQEVDVEIWTIHYDKDLRINFKAWLCDFYNNHKHFQKQPEHIARRLVELLKDGSILRLEEKNDQ